MAKFAFLKKKESSPQVDTESVASSRTESEYSYTSSLYQKEEHRQHEYEREQRQKFAWTNAFQSWPAPVYSANTTVMRW